MFQLGAYLLLALVAYVQFCTCIREPSSYLPTKDKYIPVREINWIVKQIDSGRWGDDIQTVASNLKDAARTAGTIRLGHPISHNDETGVREFEPNADGGSDSLYELLAHFESLSHDKVDSSRGCSQAGVRFLINLMEQKFGGLTKIQSLIKRPTTQAGKSLTQNYLTHFAPKLYSSCLSKLADDFGEDLDASDASSEDKLDMIVLMGQPKPSEKPDTWLALEAQKLDLAKGRFNAVKMLAAAERYLGRKAKSSWLGRESAQLLNDFIRGACVDLRLGLARPFDIYNMARLLVPEEVAKLEMTSKFRKLNEYSRICIPFRRSNEVVLANIRSNIIRYGIKSTLGLK